MNQTILIIEDEQELASILKDYFTQAGYESHVIFNGNEAVDAVKHLSPALIILDLMLPGKSGLDICKEVRSFSQTPIIMTTAKVEEIDRLLGLELGADDYICKPYSPREVVARVKAIFRRMNHTSQMNAQQMIVLDPEYFKASINGNELELTAVEFEMLNTLVKHPGRIFSRNQLMDSIYKDDRIVSDRTIDSHIKKLRKKINLIFSERELIHSVYSVGYKYQE